MQSGRPWYLRLLQGNRQIHCRAQHQVDVLASDQQHHHLGYAYENRWTRSPGCPLPRTQRLKQQQQLPHFYSVDARPFVPERLRNLEFTTTCPNRSSTSSALLTALRFTSAVPTCSQPAALPQNDPNATVSALLARLRFRSGRNFLKLSHKTDMKTKYIIASLALLGVAATSCKDKMDYNEVHRRRP